MRISWLNAYQIWHWKRKIHLKKYLQRLSAISADLDGFHLSKQARQDNDAMEYTYGEINPTAFAALLSLIQPSPEDVFYDLGSGTGKTVILCAMLYPIRKSCG